MEATNDQALIRLRLTTHKTGLVKLKNKGPLKKQYCLLSTPKTQAKRQNVICGKNYALVNFAGVQNKHGHLIAPQTLLMNHIKADTWCGQKLDECRNLIGGWALWEGGGQGHCLTCNWEFNHLVPSALGTFLAPVFGFWRVRVLFLPLDPNPAPKATHKSVRSLWGFLILDPSDSYVSMSLLIQPLTDCLPHKSPHTYQSQ